MVLLAKKRDAYMYYEKIINSDEMKYRHEIIMETSYNNNK